MNSKMKCGFEGCLLIVVIFFICMGAIADLSDYHRRQQYLNPNYPKQTLILHLSNGKTQKIPNVVKYDWVFKADHDTGKKYRVFIVKTIQDSTFEFDDLEKFEIEEKKIPSPAKNSK